MDDEDLEGLFRASLSARADDVGGDDPGARAAAARDGVRRRRRRTAVVAVVAGVVAIAPIAVVAATHKQSPTSAASHPSSWRAESYNGIQLWVPSSWGWGMTPTLEGDRMRQCGYGAYAGSGSTGDLRYSKADATPPYVGRPMEVGTSCPAPPRQHLPHVWFDSPLPVGARGASTTVEVQGLTSFRITVTDADATERRDIVESIEREDVDANGCLDAPPTSGPEQAPRTDRGGASVCLYHARETFFRPHGLPDTYLYYSTTVTSNGVDIGAAIEAIPSGSAAEPLNLCVVDHGLSSVQLTPPSTSSSPRTYSLAMGLCSGQRLAYYTPSAAHLVDEASVRLWAVDAVPLYARGGDAGNPLTPYLPH